jgi:pre-mRNA-processing factor 17
MSLALEYSSGEDEDPAILAKDAFGLSSLPSAKKSRVEESAYQLTAEAAPHVLSEVGPVRAFPA